MATNEQETVYEVYLREEVPEADVESPVRGNRLDFFDAGVWVERESARDFFPYERVQVVRERPAEEVEDS